MSVNPWIRLYREALHDPKLVTLPDRQFRAWVNCLLIADDTGLLPSRRDVAVHMRVSVVDVDQLLCDLVEAGLVDADSISGPVTTYRLHGWSKRQYVSDSSSARVRKHREKKTKQHCNGDETFPKRPCNVIESESDTESDTDTKLFPSEQEPARVKGNELNFDFSLKNGKGKRDDLEEIATRAEGLGLDAADLIVTTKRAAPKKPSAYLTALCVNRLKERLPGIDEQILRDALWGKQNHYATVCQLLVAVQL